MAGKYQRVFEEDGVARFEQFTRRWLKEIEDEGIDRLEIKKLAALVTGDVNALHESYLSNIVHNKSTSHSHRRIRAIGATNEFLHELQHGQIDYPDAPRTWQRIPVLTINGEVANTGSLSQLVSGELVPTELGGAPSPEKLPARVEDGLANLFKDAGFDVAQVIAAYPVQDVGRRHRMVAVLSNLGDIPKPELDEELQALADAWNTLTNETVTANQLKLKALASR